MKKILYFIPAIHLMFIVKLTGWKYGKRTLNTWFMDIYDIYGEHLYKIT